jgi:hypothetical protein
MGLREELKDVVEEEPMELDSVGEINRTEAELGDSKVLCENLVRTLDIGIISTEVVGTYFDDVKEDPEDDCVGPVRKFGECALEAEREPLPLDENAADEVFNNVLLLAGAPELIGGAELVVWSVVIVGEVDKESWYDDSSSSEELGGLEGKGEKATKLAGLGLAPTNAEDAVFVMFLDEVALPALCKGSRIKLEWATSTTF